MIQTVGRFVEECEENGMETAHIERILPLSAKRKAAALRCGCALGIDQAAGLVLMEQMLDSLSRKRTIA